MRCVFFLVSWLSGFFISQPAFRAAWAMAMQIRQRTGAAHAEPGLPEPRAEPRSVEQQRPPVGSGYTGEAGDWPSPALTRPGRRCWRAWIWGQERPRFCGLRGGQSHLPASPLVALMAADGLCPNAGRRALLPLRGRSRGLTACQMEAAGGRACERPELGEEEGGGISGVKQETEGPTGR